MSPKDSQAQGDPPASATPDPAREAPVAAASSEPGRRAILAGWLMTLAGVVAYIAALGRAGEGAGILDPITGQGMLGWLAGGLMIGGVGVWFAGHLACLESMAEEPPERK